MSGVGRPPRIRESYLSDAQFMLLLARALAADDARPKAWTSELSEQCEKLAKALIDAPERKVKA